MFFDLLTRRARLTPQREALYEVHTGIRYTFADLETRAAKAAALLRDQFNVQPGDRVAVLAHNSIIYIDLLFGLAKIGAIFTPLNWRLTPRELTYILNDCQPKVLFLGPEFVPVYEALRGEVTIPSLLTVEGAAFPGAEDYHKWLETSQAPASFPPIDQESPACILYTSGTTGKPKGAVIPHRQIFWNAVNTVVSWGLTEHDVSPILTPMFHAGGLFVFLTPLFYVGGRIVLGRVFDPEASLRLIDAERCTVILGVPTLFQMWMNSPAFAAADFGQVHFFISGGAPCPPTLIADWHRLKGVTVRQGYGLTEVGVNCFSMTDEEALQKIGSVGKPIFHSDMRLVDAQGNDVPLGATGELIIRGAHVCLGYWNRPDATAEALRDGWFHTGDMARQDADGFFYIAGRLKDMIISGGENIYAAEVEAVFREHEAVQDAALVGVPDEKWGEVGRMFVVLKPGYSVSVPELLAFCGTRLAKYKIPKQIRFVESLPYSPYGKVMKQVLTDMGN